MDLLIDAQCLQSASRERGIGRYTRNLIRGVRACRPHWRVRLVQLANLPPIDPTDSVGLPVLTFTPPVRVHPFELPTARLNGRYFGDWLCAFRPDAILLTSLAGEHQTVAAEFALDRRPHVAAIAYDFIPLAMADWFLRVPEVSAWYRARTALMLAADTVLSISEFTAADLRRFYPNWRGRSEVIMGAPDPLFIPLTDDEAERRLRLLAARHGLVGEFLLCCASSPDKHKNINGAVRAFAALPPDVQARHPLVIAGPIRDAATLHKVIHECDVGDRCHLIGYVSDDDLKALYHGCRLFLCPSVYEGLGLPVLEALQCGAAVVTSTESSLPEVAGGVSWLCDVRSPMAFADTITAALAEPRDARLPLRLAHARKFNWTRTAEAACRAIETTPARRRPRVAWVTPPADALAPHCPVDLPRVVAALDARFEVELVAERPDEFDDWADRTVVRFSDFLAGTSQYDLVVYTLVNDPAAGFVLAALTARPGVLFVGSESLDTLVIGTLLRNTAVALPPALATASGTYGLQLLGSTAVGVIDATADGLPAGANARTLRLTAAADALADFLADVVDDRRADDAAWVEQAVHLLVTTAAVRAAGDRLLTRWADLRTRRHPGHPPPEVPRERAVWVDVSTLFDNAGSYTGITRTTLSVVKAFLSQGRVVGFFRHCMTRGGFVGVTRECVVGLAANEGTERHPGWKESSVTAFQPDRDDVALFPGFDLNYPDAVQKVWRTVGCSVAFVLYDLIPHKFPQWFVASCGPLYSPWLTNALQASDLVFCISDCTRRDLFQFAEVKGLVAPPAAVVRLGDGELSEVKPSPKPAFAPALRASGGPGYVLLVSTIEVRKNHALVYQAWRRLLQRHGPAGVPKLVFAGSVGWMSGDLIAQLENDPTTRGHVSIISGTSDGDLAWLYTNCLFTLYPSLYEGWGLPVAEGLAFGKACLASDASAVPEIAGDLVDYHDPHDLVGYVSLLERLIFDPDYRVGRERRIRERFRRTRWTDTTAQMTAAMDVLFGTVDPEVEERSVEALDAGPPTVAFVDPALKRPA